MSEPEKPFACSVPECGMRFTNEDHLNVHTKKHDMVLQLALGQKGVVFVADQTPTPTRFIRNCEEVGLFQDLQNVNPFDETFKRAMETRVCSTLETSVVIQGDDVLHTPHVFPHLTEKSPTFATDASAVNKTMRTVEEEVKQTDSQTSIDTMTTTSNCTVTTSQRHNLSLQRGLITHCVDASLQLPVISISESEESCDRSVVGRMRHPYLPRSSRNDILFTCHSRANIDTLHPTSPEERSVQLISQKSIEQALETLTRECKEQNATERMADLKGRTPTMTILENRPLNTRNKAALCFGKGVRLKRQNPDATNHQPKDVHIERKTPKTHKVENVTRLENWIDEASQEDLANGDSATNGYELMLKLPNGKKVFLKEAHGPLDSPTEKKNVSATKEALKETLIRKRLKKTTVHQNAPPKPTVYAKVPVPANPNVFVCPQSVKYIQGVLATETTARAQVLAIVNSPPKETIAAKKPHFKVLTRPVVVKTDPKPKKNTEKIKKNEKEAKEKERDEEGREIVKDAKRKIPLRNVDERDRMAAAGRRYRHRKKESYKMLLEQNKKLQMDNEAMSRQLISSRIEIKRLRDLVNAHHSNMSNKQQAKGFNVLNSPKVFWMADPDTSKALVVHQKIAKTTDE